jgi:PKD repeat protein
MSSNNNGLDAFEQKLRDSLDQFEVPYNSSDWLQLESAMSKDSKGWWLSGLGLSLLTAGTLVIGGGAWYALSSDTQGHATVASNAVPSPAAGSPEPELPTIGTPEMAAPAQGTVTEPVVNATRPVATDVIGSGAGSVNDQVTPTSATKAAVVEKVPSSTERSDVAPVAKSTPNEPTKGLNTSHDGMNTFTASVGESCAGTAVDFKVSHMPEDGIYLWNFGDGSFSNKANPEHTFTKPGKYQVMLSMSAAGVGTIQNKPSSDVITIYEVPTAAFNVLKQEYDGHLPSVHFENRSLAGQKYRWNFGDGTTSDIPHPDHIYKKKGVYHVELVATNEIGCEDMIMKDVRIDKDYNLDAPESFSPNADGTSDSFIPEALRSLGVKFNLTMYTANGTLLYQTNDATKPWNGRPNNRGELCAPGEYVWVVDVRESLHLAETYTGKVQLVK